VAQSQPVGSLPSGAMALVFTDVEGSTELWQIDEELFEQALLRHDLLVRETLAAAEGGIEVKHTGDGFFLAFRDTPVAAGFCIDLQTKLLQQEWPRELGPVRTRIGLHYGRARVVGEDYRGPAVNLAARICNASSGGQILISGQAKEQLPRTSGLLDRLRPMGAYHLPGVADAVELYELACSAADEFDFRPLSPQPSGAPVTPHAPSPSPSSALERDGFASEDDEQRWQRVKLALRQADNVTAIEELAVLHDRHPEDPRVLTTLGVAYGIERLYEQAEHCLKLATELAPDHAAAWFNLARVYGKMGHRDRIAHAIQRALEADPHHPKARQVAAKYGIELPES